MSWYLVYVIFGWAIRIVLIALILRRRFNPATGLAWICLTMFMPEVAMVLYLLIGDHRLGKDRAAEHRRVIETTRTPAWLEAQKDFIGRPPVDPAQEPMVLQAQKIGGMPILGGNSVEFLSDSQNVISRIVADIDAAKLHVHLLFYIFATDATAHLVVDSLKRAKARGIICRVMVDRVGSRPFFYSGSMNDELLKAGILVVPLLPANIVRRRFERLDMRNHRKLAIIDGTIAYTGSQNIVDSSYGHSRMSGSGAWIDLMGRFTGPIVSQMQTTFIEDWRFETAEELSHPDIFPVPVATGEVLAQSVPTGPSHETGDFHRVLIAAINTANRRIVITSPYLVPDEPTMLSLAMAADRGVEVILVLPKKSDHPLVLYAGQSYYENLLESGVRIFLFQKGLLHAKTMTVDDSFALLGSANLDIRSFYINFEMSVLLYGPTITARMRVTQETYIRDSKELKLETWNKRAGWRPYVEQVAALASPLL